MNKITHEKFGTDTKLKYQSGKCLLCSAGNHRNKRSRCASGWTRGLNGQHLKTNVVTFDRTSEWLGKCSCTEATPNCFDASSGAIEPHEFIALFCHRILIQHINCGFAFMAAVRIWWFASVG